MKKIYAFLLLILSLCLFACTSNEEAINLYIDGNLYREINMNEYTIDSLNVREKKNTLFDGWYTDSDYEEKYEFEVSSSSLNLYGRYLKDSCLISFESNGGTPIESYIVKCGVKISEPLPPTKTNYEFDGWYCDPYLTRLYDFDTVITGSKTLYAKYRASENHYVEINYILGDIEHYDTKKDLYNAFMGEFYDFLKNNTDCDLSEFSNKEQFLDFCSKWEQDGRSECYFMGDRFAKYFLQGKEGSKVNNQPTTMFIGYCYHNGKFLDFISHLEVFFSYWRYDEGCDEYGPVNSYDLYYNSWAAMVDTAKFFYFTADTLQTKYAWFNSSRVKEALDNIPCVFKPDLKSTKIYEATKLPTTLASLPFEIAGYKDEAGNIYTEITNEFIDNNLNKTINLYIIKK